MRLTSRRVAKFVVRFTAIAACLVDLHSKYTKECFLVFETADCFGAANQHWNTISYSQNKALKS